MLLCTLEDYFQSFVYLHNRPFGLSFPLLLLNRMGDPIRALQAKTILHEIKSKDLVKNAAETGAYLKQELEQLESKYPKVLSAVRGRGTFLAFDLPDPQQRDLFVSNLRSLGVNTGGCGPKSIRLRPMLVFQKKHADIFLEAVEKVASESS